MSGRRFSDPSLGLAVSADCNVVMRRVTFLKTVCQHSHKTSHLPMRTGFVILSVLVCWCLLGVGATESRSMLNTAVSQRTARQADMGEPVPKTICPSMDIRNDQSPNSTAFRQLAQCDVIEGSLALIVVDIGDQFSNISFPRLRQVTHYVLLYRLRNLSSLSKMFPNLVVIRGYELFHHYALILYETQLHDLGLVSLKRIMRGRVRIEKNRLLCYLRTIDWFALTGQNPTSHEIQDNRETSLDPSEGGESCTQQECPDECGNFTVLGITRRACWTSEHCQTPQNPECHPLCEGGCTKHGSKRHCFACKYVEYQEECLEKCPTGTYVHGGWRCVTREKCLEMNALARGTIQTAPYMAFNGTCLRQCPSGHEPSPDKTTCVKCRGLCPKICKDKMVDSALRAQALRGCTKIEGSLRIEVSGQDENIISELEESLSEIRIITGFLRVSNSEPLVSMNFLKNLEVIEGRTLEADHYAMYFLHNHNLQSLWPNTTNIKVLNGRVFFHFNHRLCLDKIYAMINRFNITKPDNTKTVDIGKLTNGDKVPCQRKLLKTWVSVTTSTAVMIGWETFRSQINDYRNLLGYNLYYREAPEQNITLFGGRDACGRDSWKVVDFRFTDAEKENRSEILPNLKPYTQYAYYMETMVADAGANATSGQSAIQYFTTNPDEPTSPQNLRVISLKADPNQPGQVLQLQWDPPREPNGVITHYLVRASVELEQLDQNFDSCKDMDTYQPTQTPKPTAPQRNTSLLLNPHTGQQCCECPAEGDGGPPTGGQHAINADKRRDQIWFENMLQNAVFKKNPKRIRKKRSISSSPARNAAGASGASPGRRVRPPCTRHNVTAHGGFCHEFEDDFEANKTQNSAVLTNLRYFAEYTVEVFACQARVNGSRLCSQPALAGEKTNKYIDADSLESRPEIANRTAGGHVTLSWLDPADPNGGHVLSYIIYYRRVDGEPQELVTKKHICQLKPCPVPPCRREASLQLPMGNISIQVQARTLAGLGKRTPPIYIVLSRSGTLSVGVIVAIVVSVLFLLVVIVAVALLFVCRQMDKQRQNDVISWNPYYGGLITEPYEPDDWEVDIEKVHFDREIGKGSFGSVYAGTALLRSRSNMAAPEQLYSVAIKTVLENASMYDRQAFLSEASLMKNLNCYHVVRLMGIVSNMNAQTEQAVPRPPFVIMELMQKGDLKSYLRSMRPEDDGSSVPSDCALLPNVYQMAAEIADGMAYLAQQNSVHRDLAARNCMVTEDVTIKIGDFGMTRHLYEKDYYKKGGKGLLPVRWMGPESLRDGMFTSQSDVWSYGVVLWEMVTYAAQPYQGLSNEEVISHVLNRNRMSRPLNCPEPLYDIMYRCWEYRASDRPTFVQLVEELMPHVTADFYKHSFYHTQRPAMLAAAAADQLTELEPEPEPEPTVLTPLTGGNAVHRLPLMAEQEDLSDEEPTSGGGLLELLPSANFRLPSDANYAEFAAIKKDRRNGGHSSVSSSAENSKAHSLQFSSSDGSKGSKASNGSARNGYVAGGGGPLSSQSRTAEC